jgi:hypothetical protein
MIRARCQEEEHDNHKRNSGTALLRAAVVALARTKPPKHGAIARFVPQNERLNASQATKRSNFCSASCKFMKLSSNKGLVREVLLHNYKNKNVLKRGLRDIY